MSRNPFGWDYPAGAEDDPRAPYNQRSDEMEAVFRLMNESGVTGPVGRETFEDGTDRRTINQAAHAWADGQIGHPWDLMTVEFDDECWELEL
jgi:hypothetical protein